MPRTDINQGTASVWYGRFLTGKFDVSRG